MLLRQLLSALAAGARRRPARDIVETRTIPGVRIDRSKEAGLIYDRPFQEIAAKLQHDEVWSLFSDLDPPEQLRLIETELDALPAEERKRVLGLLTKELGKAWLPLPGPQTSALRSQADILFYGGGAGSGKSSLLCGTALTQHHRVRLFRREAKQVRGLVDECHKILGRRDGFNGQDDVWRIPGRDTVIEFAHCHYEQDKENYQGRAADLIGFDEITHFTESQFRYLIGWNRPMKDGLRQRSRVIATGNPPERPEGRWVLSFWAPWLDKDHPNPAADGELRWFTTINGEDIEVDGPGPHGEDEHGQPVMARSRTFIRGLLRDNPYLVESGYGATLQSHPEPLRSMLLLGRFDVAVNDDPWQVIPSEWIELAQRRWTSEPPEGRGMSCIGVDVAQGGVDETILAPRHGTWFAPVTALKGIDTKNGSAVAGIVFATMRDACEIAIDVGGGWGADAHGHLKAQQINSVAVNWVETSSAKTRSGSLSFLNKRAEAWWRLREALDPVNGEKIALPPDKTLAADLATPIWHRTPAGLIKIEDKAEIRKRLGRSPDRGDAVVMAWANGWLLEMERANNPKHPTIANLGYPDVKRLPTRAVTKKPRYAWR